VPSGQVVTGVPAVTVNPTVSVGGINATLISAVLSPGSAGLYQVAIQIPDSVADGDLPVVAEVQGVAVKEALVRPLLTACTLTALLERDRPSRWLCPLTLRGLALPR